MKYMKPIITLSFVLLTFLAPLYAQRGDYAKERIHAAKMAYITDRIHLTAAQSGEFIPLYTEYEQEARAAKQPYKAKYTKEHPDAREYIIMQYVADDLNCQEEILTIKKKYQDRFLKIISQKQIDELNMSEREFKQILIKRLKEKNGKWE